MPLENHEKYALKSGIKDTEKYIQMKLAWLRISFRIRDYDTAIRFNKRNLKRKVPDDDIEKVAQDIRQRVQDFEREFRIAYLDKFNQMLKVKRR
jgi:hypothetical protein